MKYHASPTTRRRWPRRLVYVFIFLVILFIAGAAAAQYVYRHDLRPVDSGATKVQHITIASGSSVPQIAKQLKAAGLIRSEQIFEWYINVHDERSSLQAGTYNFSASQSTPAIIKALVDGKVATDLVTILPGQRLDQVSSTFLKAGFSQTAIDNALNAKLYVNNPALTDKPADANLEGFLYPDSYQKDANTDPQVIVTEALQEMQQHLTPEIRAAFAAEGLSVYQGVTLASVVEQEVSKPDDRAQAAQVFLKRIHSGMPLGSDVTAYYGAIIAGQKPSTDYDSPYNTLLHKGLPPGPIGSISDSSLNAVAHPANTDWLYFVSGDNGNTYFSKTLAEHQALTQQYCHRLCSVTQ